MDFLILSTFFIVSTSLGLRIFDSLKLRVDYFNEKLVYAAVLGTGLIAYLIFFLGMTGSLYGWSVISLIAVLALFSVREIKCIFSYLLKSIRSIKLSKLSIFDRLLLALIFSAVCLTLMGAMAPPTGHDSLSYRLAQVRIFSSLHGFSYLPYTRESLWPYLMESLFTGALSVGTDILIKLIAWMFGVISAFGVYVIARKYFGRRAGYIACAIFLLTPAIFTQMSFAYVDIPLALYSFVSFLCAFYFFRDNNPRWVILSGIFCGFALSIKLVAIITILSVLTVFVYHIVKGRSYRRLYMRGVFLFCVFVFLFSFIWYLRSYMIKGNPFYPFFGNVFGSGWSQGLENNIGSHFSFVRLIRLPWDLTMFSGASGGENCGIIYLLFLPIVLTFRRKKVIFRDFMIFIAMYALLWFYIDPFVNRFLFPIFLPLSILIAGALKTIFKNRGGFNGFVKIILSVMLFFNFGILVYHNMDKVRVALGIQSKEAYLMETERTYGIAKKINEIVPDGATILMVNEIRSYYIERPYIHLKNFLEEEKISDEIVQSKAFLDEISGHNIKYILVNTSGTSYPWMDIIYVKRDPICTYSFKDSDERTFSYEVYSTE